jgi:hypothetical protein
MNNTLPSFLDLRNAIAARLPTADRSLILNVLVIIAGLANDLPAPGYPPDLVEAYRELFEDEIRQFRRIYADLTAHYLILGFTAEEADSQVNHNHFWPDYFP